MPDQLLNVSPEALGKLVAIRRESKFHPRSMYPGAPDEATRLDAERAVNQMLDRLVSGLPRSPSKTFVLSEFHKDKEDGDQFASEAPHTEPTSA